MLPNMSEYEYIDESGNVPSIKGRRINMIDVTAVIESGDEHNQFEYWGLSDEKREEAIEYYEENEEEIQQIMQEQTPPKEE